MIDDVIIDVTIGPWIQRFHDRIYDPLDRYTAPNENFVLVVVSRIAVLA
jgi:hypothetical protein